jgi:hypothetical protein
MGKCDSRVTDDYNASYEDNAGVLGCRHAAYGQHAHSSNNKLGHIGGLTMKQKSRESNAVQASPNHDDQIAAYSAAQPIPFRTICGVLRELIDAALPKATSKVWHGSPVWFIDENPVVGYNATAKTVKLLFWNGQAFEEPALEPVGRFQAAQAVFGDAAEIDPKVIRRWLKKAKADVFDSKAFFGKLRKGK